MANPSWYNDNQFRSYPFITRVEPLAQTSGFGSESSDQLMLHIPHSTIVDFGAIMEIDAEFDESAGHYVYLHSISRFADIFTFKLRTNATGSENDELVFHRELTSPEFLISWETASTISPEAIETFACAIQPRWSGFLVTGSMQAIAAVISNGETWLAPAGLWQIEPARIQSLMQSYLRSISLANSARLHATPQIGCEASSSYAANHPVILNARCLTGTINWKEGFNCSVRQDVNTNAIIIGAGVGIGEGLPCDEIPLYPGEKPPAGSPFLSGGPACNEIVKSINGAGGTELTIIAGPGFRIQPDSVNPNKLIIDRSLDNFILCNTPLDVTSSLSIDG